MAVNDEHPEGTCEQCGGPNICWWVDSDRWNLAVRTDGTDPMLCPSCFVRRWETATGMVAVWRLVPEHLQWPTPEDAS